MTYFRIIIQGIVQGVGFRPFLYNLARKYHLKGSIINKGNIGVEMVLCTLNKQSSDLINDFLRAIRQEKPDIAYIESIIPQTLEESDLYRLGYNKDEIESALRIKPSESGKGSGLTLPPDIAICDKCLEEMRDPDNERFYKYPFIACAQCGPRFTTVQALPYDRERTTMSDFPLCRADEKGANSCQSDYKKFKNRRFHAQTFSCKRAGPNYYLMLNSEKISERDFIEIAAGQASTGSSIAYEECLPDKINLFQENPSLVSRKAPEAVRMAAALIRNGKIGAIMGIGGVHLVCLATDDIVIAKLRTRKRNRKYKPFAIMVRNIDNVREYAQISEEETKLLQSFRRPIVLLDKKEGVRNEIADNVAPGLPNIGLILPYAGIHYLLFEYVGDVPLVFTSGNVSHVPMAITPEDVMSQLSELADFFLLHNRTIYQRCDDSVLRVNGRREKLIRRSRGYVPEYIPLPFKTEARATIAVGPELNSTGAVAKGYRIFPTQHIGHGTSVEAYQFLKESLSHMQDLLQIGDEEIDIVAHDMHPLFNSTQLAEEIRKRIEAEDREILDYSIQHHYAHAASLMVDNKVKFHESAVVASLDGVGYGDDGRVWGGEIVYGKYYNLARGSHFEYIPMIGGDRCVKYPVRMLVGFLIKEYGVKEAKILAGKLDLYDDLEYGRQELDALFTAFNAGHNIAFTSSCGRLLDAVSALLSVCVIKTYRGEPAMRLEGAASSGDPYKYDLYTPIVNEPNIKLPHTIPTRKLISMIISLMKQEGFIERRKEMPLQFSADVAASLLYSVGNLVAYFCLLEAKSHDIPNIGLSGGVSYNGLISESFYSVIKEAKAKLHTIELLEHKDVPPGDAGISIGQVAVAVANFNHSQGDDKHARDNPQ